MTEKALRKVGITTAVLLLVFALAFWQKAHAESHLTGDDRIDGNLALVAPKPLDDPGVRGRLGRFAEDLRVDQALGADPGGRETARLSGRAGARARCPDPPVCSRAG